MADDNYLVTYTLKLDPGDVVSASGTAGKQSGDAFAAQFKPDLTKALDVDTGKFAGSVKKAFQGINLTADLEKTFHDWNFSKTNFGKNLAESVKDAISKVEPTVKMPPTPAAPAGPSFAQYAQPLVSGMEAFAMLLRGAPLLSVAQMAGQALTSAAALGSAQRAAAAAGGEHAGLPSILPMSTAAAAGASAEASAAKAATGAVSGRTAAVAGGTGILSGLLPGGIGGLLKLGGIATGIGSVIEGGNLISDAIEDAGVKAAETNKRFDNMSQTMGMTRQRFNELQMSTAKSGVGFEEFGSHLYRLTLNAQRQLPAIQHEVEDAANKREEVNIRERESIRAVEKADRDRAASLERVAVVEGEVAKFQATRADERQQQAQAAALAVSGAQIGLTGAQMQRTQAEIQRRFAPAEAALADIRGPQTVRGAELGATGARIALAEARIRFEGGDPSQDEDLQDRKKRHALQVAINNRDQAELHERDARLSEARRLTQKAEGVGPEAQAEQAARSAAQAEQQAQLHTQQVQTAQTGLTITQGTHTLQMESNEMDRKLLQAKADQLQSLEDQPGIAAIRAAREKRDFPLHDIETVQKFITGKEGLPGGLKFENVLPDTFRKAFFRETEGDPEKINKLAHDFFTAQQEAGVPRAQQLARFSQLFQARGLGGARLEEELSMFQRPEAQLTDAQRNRARDLAEQAAAGLPASERIQATVAVKAQTKANNELERGLAAQQQTEEILRNKFVSKFTDYLKLQGIKGVTGVDEMFGESAEGFGKLLRAPEAARPGGARFEELNVKPVSPATPRLEELNVKPPDFSGIGEGAKSAIDGGGDKVAGALQGAADKIGTVQFTSPKQSGAEGTEARAPSLSEAVGGPIHGSGTGTSDSIPANLSAGEFVVTADGRNLKDAISYFGARGFAEGGEVDPKKKGDLGTWAAIIKSSQWGAWLAKIGLPMMGVAIPAAADAALGLTNPAISAALALKAVWDETHSHPPMTLGDVLKEQRGGQTVSELMAQHFAENRQATFDERFPDQKDTFDERFGFQTGGNVDVFNSNDYDETGKLKPEAAKRIAAQLLAKQKLSAASTGSGIIARGQIHRGQIATSAAPSTRIIFNPFVGRPSSEADYAAYEGRSAKDTGSGPVPGFTDTGPAIGGVTPIVPSGGDRFVTTPMGPGDKMLRKGSGGDQTYFGGQDRAIRAKDYVGSQDIERPSQQELDDQRRAEMEKQDRLAGGQDYAEGGSISDRDFADPRGEQGSVSDRSRADPRGEQGSVDDRAFADSRISISDRSRADPRGEQGSLSDKEFARLSAMMKRSVTGMADGGVVGAIANLPSRMMQSIVDPIASGYSNASASMSQGSGASALSYHQLDIRTNAGNFTAAVSAEQMEVIQQSSLARQMSRTGPRPTWFS